MSISLEKITIDHDEEADVPYISFGKPREAEDTIEVNVGITIILRSENNSERKLKEKELKFPLLSWHKVAKV